MMRVIKGVRPVGHASREGVSFPESALMERVLEAFMAVEAEVAKMSGVTTRPAEVKVIVEQEVMIRGRE